MRKINELEYGFLEKKEYYAKKQTKSKQSKLLVYTFNDGEVSLRTFHHQNDFDFCVLTNKDRKKLIKQLQFVDIKGEK